MDARVRRHRKRFPAVSVRKSRDRERQLSVRSTETSLSPSLNRRTGCVALGIGWTQNFDHQSVPSASLKLHRPASYLPRRAPHVLYRSRYDLTNYSGVCVSDCFFVRVTLTRGEAGTKRGSGGRWTKRSGASYISFTLVPVRPRSRGARRFLRTDFRIRLSPPIPRWFRSRRASTPFNSTPDAFRRHPDVASYGQLPSTPQRVRRRGRRVLARHVEGVETLHGAGEDGQDVFETHERRHQTRGREEDGQSRGAERLLTTRGGRPP